MKSFIVMVTCSAGILSGTKGDSSEATASLLFISSLSSENVLITGLQGGYQHRHPVNSPETAHKMRIKGAEGGGDDRQECMKVRCAEVFKSAQTRK